MAGKRRQTELPIEDEIGKQVLFLIDSACENVKKESLHINSLYLACCRILYHCAGFIRDKNGVDKVRWNYELFNSRIGGVVLKKKGSSFKEFRTETLERFHTDLESHFCDSTPPLSSDNEMASLKIIYSKLASVVQDYQWDMPLLMSPLPQKTNRLKRRKNRKDGISSCTQPVRNLIFLISEKLCNVEKICGLEMSGRNLRDYIEGCLFPPPLTSQLYLKRITVHAVWMTMETNMVNRVLQDVLHNIDGKIIPLSTLITPIHDLDCQERCHGDLLSYSDICDSENEREHIKRRGKVTLALPPSVFTNYHLMDQSSLSHTSHHLLCDDSGGVVSVLELSPINNSLTSIEEGPAIFKPLGLINKISLSDISLNECYTCIGLTASEEIHQLYTRIFTSSSEHNKTNILQTTPTSKTQRNSSSTDVVTQIESHEEQCEVSFKENPLLYQNEQPQNPSSVERPPGEVVTPTSVHRRHSSRLLLKGSPDYVRMANPWRRKRKQKVENEGVVNNSLINESSKSDHVIDTPTQLNSTNEEQFHNYDHTSSDSTRYIATLPSQVETIVSCNNNKSVDCQESADTSIITNEEWEVLSEEWKLLDHCENVSKQFENMNLWLSGNELLLVLNVSIHNKCDRQVVLQPITPLMTTLTFVTPSCQDKIVSFLTREPLHDKCSSSNTSREDKQYGGLEEVRDTIVRGDMVECKEGTNDEGSIYPEDSDIFLSLNSLLPHKSHDHTALHNSHDYVWSSLLHPSLHPLFKEPFSWYSLTNYTHLIPKYGLRHSTMDQLKELHDDISLESTAPHISSKLLTKLKTLYSPNSVGELTSGCHDNEAATSIVQEDENPLSPRNYVKTLEVFSTEYITKISTIVEEIEVLQWVTDIIQRLISSFQLMEREKSTLWVELQERVLLDDKQLRKLYEDKDDVRRIEGVMANEYLLQILLHFEVCRHSKLVQSDILVHLLRHFSLLTNPGHMGKLLKNVILPEYSSCCQTLLKDIYDQLMLPVPSCLSPDESIDEHGNETMEHENETSDVDEKDGIMTRVHRSLETVFGIGEETDIQPRKTLTRHSSFQRQIAITRQNAKPHNSSDRTSHKVRRSLFKRSLSIGGMENGKRIRLDEEEDRERYKKLQRHHTLTNVVVKETPLKKQVDNYRRFKLQRIRSKTSIDHTLNHTHDISVVEESPRRSFYSQSRSCDQFLSPSKNIIFKTPPLKALSPRVHLRKNSPAILQSLLQSDFNNSFHTINNSTETTPTLENSPDLFSESVLSLDENLKPKSDHNISYIHTNLTLSPNIDSNVTLTPIVSPASGVSTPRRSILKTPERNVLNTSSEKKKVSFGFISQQNMIDEVDSASMVAFSLSTPTKNDPIDFHKCLRES